MALYRSLFCSGSGWPVPGTRTCRQMASLRTVHSANELHLRSLERPLDFGGDGLNLMGFRDLQEIWNDFVFLVVNF